MENLLDLTVSAGSINPPSHMNYTINTFKYPTDNLRLRDLFYSDDRNDRKEAISTVARWRTRGKPPHGIESTALLVSAQLHDSSPDSEELESYLEPPNSHDDFLLRTAYSAALIRFVNGILDPLQQGSCAIPLLLLAKRINLPYSFVEIRHYATHELLPSLELLRVQTKKALVWLDEFFWGQYTSTEGHTNWAVTVARGSTVNVTRAFRTWRKFSVKNLDATEYTSQLVSLSRDAFCSTCLVRAIVEDMEDPASFLELKAPLVKLIAVSDPGFLFKLIVAIIYSDLKSSQDVMCSWIKFLVPRLLNGSFPVVYFETYSKSDILHCLRTHCEFLDPSSPILRAIKSSIDDEVSERKRFALPPLLDEILSVKDEISSVKGTQNPDRKRPVGSSIFEEYQKWKPTPFGIVPE